MEETGEGIYKLKSTVHSSQFTEKNREPSTLNREQVYFLLSCEISSIYSQGGKVRKIHNLVLVPSLAVAKKINNELIKLDANLRSDGRPIIGISAKDLADLVLNIEPKSLIIPAHIWTPWFSLYGSNSGFDSLTECFGDWEKYIYAVETGLSSDPAMNWQISELDNRAIVSFSDAHSPAKMGRELTVFDLDQPSYQAVYEAITNQRIAFTVEFFPEEGKYHYSGHRNCQISYSAKELKEKGETCPKCGQGLTIGVASRVEDLATKILNFKFQISNGVKWIHSDNSDRPPYVMLVPLIEIIAEALQLGEQSKAVKDEYDRLIVNFGSELAVLLKASREDLEKTISPKLVETILKVRQNDIFITPGFDGQYGVVKIWPTQVEEPVLTESAQMALL